MKILICGAGIAGTTLAAFISKNCKNVRIDVIEKRHSLQYLVNRGVGLWPNAINALSHIDIHGDLFKKIPAASYRNIKGIWLSSCSEEMRKQVSVSTILENTLINEIYNHSHKDSINLHFNHDVLEISSSQDGDVLVAAQFNNQKVEFRGDIVVDARGMQINQDQMDYLCMSGFIEQFKDIGLPFETLNEGSRFAVVPLPNHSVYWFCNIPHKYRQNDNHLQIIQNTFKNHHDPIPEIINKTNKSNIIQRFYAKQQSKVEQIISNQIISIGDACHHIEPNLAQGATIAIEDAFELSKLIQNNQNMQKLNAIRQSRIQTHKLVTYFTHILAKKQFQHITNMMQYVPNPINSIIFDQFLQLGLGYNYKINKKE